MIHMKKLYCNLLCSLLIIFSSCGKSVVRENDVLRVTQITRSTTLPTKYTYEVTNGNSVEFKLLIINTRGDLFEINDEVTIIKKYKDEQVR